MPRPVTFHLRKSALALGVVLFGISGALFGIQTSVVSARPSVKPAPILDHFLCYQATPVKSFNIPSNVVLTNQFTKHDHTKLKPKISQSPLVHCNPVAKYILTRLVAPINKPNAHLLCYPITVPVQPVHVVQVTNQFGTATLDTGQPIGLCLPTWKSLVGPPGKTPNEPPGLDHFTCYPVTYDPNTVSTFNPPNPNVSLQDQFAPAPVQVTVGDPETLCLPTTKTVGAKVYKPIKPAPVQDHLLCFAVTQTPFLPTIWDQNQFGTGQLNLVQTVTLCVPSEKVLLH